MDGQAFRLVGRIGSREFRLLLRGEAVLGSAPECGLVLPDPTVSRRHARLSPNGAGVLVEDLGSSNGTRVEGSRIDGAVLMAAGGRVQFGEVELRVESVALGDLGVAIGAAAIGPPPSRQEPAALPEPTLVSAGLTRFCVRELEPLLLQLADGAALEPFAAAVLAALAAAEPRAGFRLLRGQGGAVLARAGERGEERLCVAHGDMVLEVWCEPGAATAALRTLGNMALALVLACDRAGAQGDPGSKPAAPGHAAARPPPVASTNPRLREIYWQAAQVARSRLNVLLSGESGTGKELLARYLHEASPEPADRFLVLNCAALPADLLDAELFGIEAGVATGVSARAGRFELAHGGTLFLDEIGDMSLDTQARILRVLQEREVYRVGSHKPRPADVRVVSATNRDLEAMVRQGRFRLDLFHRIADWRAELPPLRERREDIGNLAAQFLGSATAARGIRSGGLSQGAVDALTRYGWPGNVRELEREMSRAALFIEDGEVLVSTMLKPEILACTGEDHGDQGMAAQLELEERRIIARALSACSGQVAQAAERLGVSKSTLYRRLAHLGIDAGAR